MPFHRAGGAAGRRDAGWEGLDAATDKAKAGRSRDGPKCSKGLEDLTQRNLHPDTGTEWGAKKEL